MKFSSSSSIASSITSDLTSVLTEDSSVFTNYTDLNLGVRSYVDGHSIVRISVSDRDCTDHRSALVVCVLDVSYSMDEPAVMHGDIEGKTGLSLLDIVKHATQTVIEGLASTDFLAVVEFASTAKIVVTPTRMTAQNKASAWQKVKNLKTCGNTNLWDGLVKAMDLVGSLDGVETNSNIVLLTDGIPNVRPPRGELRALDRYLDKHTALKSTSISTFGFGSSLDATLLNNIAVRGGGHFCFIPDSSFVGTVFVNTVANILSNAMPKCTLFISSHAEMENLSGLPSIDTSWGLSIEVPPLIHGQTIDILLKSAKTIPFEASFSGAVTSCDGSLFESDDDLVLAKIRSEMISLTRSGDTYQQKRLEVRALVNKVGYRSNEPRLIAFMRDLEGQVVEALSRGDYYKKWGRHYLPALGRAHALQQCSNFKDPGLQVYSTRMFSLLQDELEDIFTGLPPPEPSRKKQCGPRYQPVRSMTSYYNVSSPCFAQGNVNMADGSTRDISLLRRGDKVSTGGEIATVRCMVETACCSGTEHLVELEDGVWVTPWHPVRKIGTTPWLFPATLNEPKIRPCKSVFSFVLEGNGFLRIGHYDGVALGHGIEDDPVAKHDYLGSNKVIESLKLMDGWDDGYIKMKGNPCIRDPASNLIVGFEQG